ncbi:hypothetical protein C0992_005473 [Termitomyces sp. T32_za158]|nr:hypothetical protein C0992_005473 [Termitomyces sp. T32_za158]
MSKRPTSTKQPSSQSHRRRSSGDLTKKQLDEFTVLLDDIESRVIELRDNPKWGDLEEVQQLAQEIQTLSTRVNRFKKIKTEDPEAVIVSLSNMDFNLLKDRLGVKDPVLVAAGHSPQDFLAGVQTALQGYDLGPCDFPDIVEIVTAWDCSFLFNLLKTYAKNINNSTEAAARIIIDPWIIGSLQLVEAIKSNASAKYRTVLLPELLVWSAQSGNQKDGPAIIKYKENITHLAGSIDYVTVNYHLPYLNLQEPGDIGQFAYRHRGRYNLETCIELSIDPFVDLQILIRLSMVTTLLAQYVFSTVQILLLFVRPSDIQKNLTNTSLKSLQNVWHCKVAFRRARFLKLIFQIKGLTSSKRT